MNLKGRSKVEMANAGSITVKFDAPTKVTLEDILVESGKKSKALLPNVENTSIVSKVLEAHLYNAAVKTAAIKKALIKDEGDTFDWIPGQTFIISSDKDWNYTIQLAAAVEDDKSIDQSAYDVLPQAAQNAYEKKGDRWFPK